jgi:rhamnosyltransferase
VRLVSAIDAVPDASTAGAVIVAYHPLEENLEQWATVVRLFPHTLIIDNSTDGAHRARVAARAEAIGAVYSLPGENIGLARAYNFGAQWARQRGLAWVLLLDQDTVLGADAGAIVADAWRSLERRDEVAIFAMSFVERATQATIHVPSVPRSSGAATARARDVLEVPSSGSFIPLDAYRRLGPFFEALFLDGVDVEYCYRARGAGLRIVQTVGVCGQHVFGSPERRRLLGREVTTMNMSVRRWYLAARNVVILTAIYGARDGALTRHNVGRYGRMFLKLLLLERDRLRKVSSVLRGAFDGLGYLWRQGRRIPGAPERLPARVRAGVGPWSRAIARQALRRIATYRNLYRLLVAPFGLRSRRGELHVRRRGALGDVLMCLPALAAAKAERPDLKICFYTDAPDLLAGHPAIDVLAAGDAAPRGTIDVGYERLIPPPRHIATIFGEQIGVDVASPVPTLVVDAEAVGEWRRRLGDDGGVPLVVISRRAGPWTPNKDWPAERWAELTARLTERYRVVEIGLAGDDTRRPASARFTDLRGKTRLQDLPPLLAAASAYVGPISGPVHVAAGVGTPSVVIYGGYESPVCSSYPENIDLTSTPACSPCWLQAPCPYGKACLSAITVEQVGAAVATLVGRSRRSAAQESA